MGRKYLVLLLLSATAGVLATLGVYKIAARFIVKGFPVISQQDVVSYITIPDLYAKNIEIVKPAYNYIENGIVYNPVEITSNLSAFVIEGKLRDTIKKCNVFIELKSNNELNASVMLLIATTNSSFSDRYSVEDLIKLNYNRDVSLKYIYNNNTYNLYVLNFKVCKPSYYYCKLNYTINKNETFNQYFYIILVTEGTGSSKVWSYEVDITP